MTADEALQLLARLCAGSVGSALRELDGEIEVGGPVVLEQGASPFADAPAPGISASVVLGDGPAGESILLASEAVARRLAAAAAGSDPVHEEDLDALVGRVAVHVATAVATTAGGILGQVMTVGEPSTLRFAAPEEAGGSSEKSPHVFVVPFAVGGEPGRFVQCVQNAFLIKAAPGLDEIAELSEAAASTGDAVPDEALHDVKVRVWAELGRASLPLAQAVSIPSGAVVQLDRSADDPVELFVNGRLFAHGRLVVREEEWAVEIEELVDGMRAELAAVVDTGGETLDREPQPAPAAADNPAR